VDIAKPPIAAECCDTLASVKEQIENVRSTRSLFDEYLAKMPPPSEPAEQLFVSPDLDAESTRTIMSKKHATFMSRHVQSEG
jgi:hypothetical protein